MVNLYELPLEILEKILLMNCCSSMMLINKEMYKKISYIKKIYEYNFENIYKKWKNNKKILIERISQHGHINKLIFLFKNYRFSFNNTWILKNAALMSKNNVILWAIDNFELNSDDYNCIIEYSVLGKNLDFLKSLNFNYNKNNYIEILKTSSKIAYYDCIIWSLDKICKLAVKFCDLEEILLEIIKSCSDEEISHIIEILKDNNYLTKKNCSFLIGLISSRSEEFFNNMCSSLRNNINKRKSLLVSAFFGKINNFKYLYDITEKDENLINIMVNYSSYSHNSDVLKFLISNNLGIINYKNIALYGLYGGHIDIIKFAMNNYNYTDHIESLVSNAIIYGKINILVWLLNNFALNDYDTVMFNALNTMNADSLKILIYYINTNKIKINNRDLLLFVCKRRNHKYLQNLIIKML